MDSEKILVLSEGEVVESGNHQTLYADVNGKYRKMWDSQLQAAMKESPSMVELMKMGTK